MLIHPMVDRMRGLGLAAMADVFLEMQRTGLACCWIVRRRPAKTNASDSEHRGTLTTRRRFAPPDSHYDNRHAVTKSGRQLP